MEGVELGAGGQGLGVGAEDGACGFGGVDDDDGDGSKGDLVDGAVDFAV